MEMILTTIAIVAFVILGVFTLFTRFYHKVEQGTAMIVNTLKETPEVTFTGRLVLPVIHKREIMNIALKTIEIDRSGKDGLICQDNIRADIKVTFFVRVNKTTEDVLKVAQAIGCARASDQQTVEELFSAKFSEALKTVGKALEFVDLYQERDRFRDEIIRNIGNDLNGYVLEDAAIDYLEQTPIEELDPENILDAQGIRKITDLTAREHVITNEYKRDEQMKIKKKDVETRETILELERQEADAEAKQQREIASVRAREQAEASKIQSEERQKYELARIRADQEIQVQEESKQREVEIAQKNRLRAIAIEDERVTRARDLEVIERKKQVELQDIEKEKAVEAERKIIADIVRTRIAVDRTVAEEEEAIKELRKVAEANRDARARVIEAEAMAEQALVKEVKAAEAEERKSKFLAQEEVTLAHAALEAADKRMQAKKLEAEGIQAIEAAAGLARVKVEEAEAMAIEQQGEANAKVKIADAEAVAKMGQAEAAVIQARFAAEAQGLREKFTAMQEMDAETRAHEEYRMRLDLMHTETMKAIDANTKIADKQAEVLSSALANAKIDIVGGEGDYFQRFVNGLSIGKAIDGAIDRSATLKTVLSDHLKGDANLLQDLRGILSSESTESLKNISLASFLSKIQAEGTDDQRALIDRLIKSFAH